MVQFAEKPRGSDLKAMVSIKQIVFINLLFLFVLLSIFSRVSQFEMAFHLLKVLSNLGRANYGSFLYPKSLKLPVVIKNLPNPSMIS